MKKALVFLFLLAGLASCNINPVQPIRIMETNEKTFVELPHNLYRPVDTVIVIYNISLDKWVVDTNWRPFTGNRSLNGLYYKAVFIQEN